MCTQNEEQVTNMPAMCRQMMTGMAEGDDSAKSCPMSRMFKGDFGRRGFGLLAMIPGLLFVLVGVAIIFEPQILVWLMAGVSIAVGIALFAVANFFRRLAAS